MSLNTIIQSFMHLYECILFLNLRYGIQTCWYPYQNDYGFENDVKEYGIQTPVSFARASCEFENDVKEQTLYKEPVLTWDIFRYI